MYHLSPATRDRRAVRLQKASGADFMLALTTVEE